MYQLTLPAHRRLVFRSGPVAGLDDFALIYWFRTWLVSEEYRGCHAIAREVHRREALGQLRVAQLVDGFRDKYSGVPDFTGMNGLLNSWYETYPVLFTGRAARQWLRRQAAPARCY